MLQAMQEQGASPAGGCLGWREWLALPQLGIRRIKAKVDTGARTSALHAFRVSDFIEGGAPWVEFELHPLQRNTRHSVTCRSPALERRRVRDSGGHVEARWVISSLVALGEHRWDAEITLTDRDDMRFRMLLGRTALAGRFLVDAGRSYLQARRPRATRQRA